MLATDEQRPGHADQSGRRAPDRDGRRRKRSAATSTRCSTSSTRRRGRRRPTRSVACWRKGWSSGLANHTALISRDGTERPIADSGAPIRDAQGATRGAVLVFRDVTEERARGGSAAAERREAPADDRERSRLRDLHARPEGRVASWNPGAERIKGYREEEILGAHFSRFFTPEDVASGQAGAGARAPASRGDSRTRAGGSARTDRASGRTSSSAPMRDAVGPARRLRQDHA